MSHRPEEADRPISERRSAAPSSESRATDGFTSEIGRRLSVLFESAPTGILVANGTGERFLHANPAICRMLGYTEAELLELGVADIHPAEALLAASEHLLKAVTDNAVDCIFVKDFNRRYTLANRAFQTLVGLPEERIVGKTPDEIFGPEQALIIREVDDRAFAGETVVETRSLEVGGRKFFFNTSQRPLSVKDGKILSIMGIVRDVTARMEAEEALRKSEERYRTIIETTAEWIWEIDLEGRHLFTNKAVTTLLGYRPEEIIGHQSSHFVHEDDRREVAAKLPRFVAEKRGWRGWVIRWRHKDGTIRFLESNADPLVDAAGACVGYIGADRDITERVLAEEERRRLLDRELEARHEAEAALRVRDEFLSIAAHDLKTPLGALQIQIEGMSKVWREGKLSPSRLEKGLDILDRLTGRLIRLVNGLLTLSRIQSGRFELRRDACDLGERAREVCCRLVPMLDRADCRLVTSVKPGATGHWDGERLEQIIENLLANAVKFGAGEPIRLEVTIEANKTRLTVESGGGGIAPEMAESIFEPFERGGAAPHHGGMGMGLYIARTIATAHGGTLRAESGAGARFILELPLGEPNTSTPPRGSGAD